MSAMLHRARGLASDWRIAAAGLALLAVVGLGFVFFGGGGDRTVRVDFKDVTGLVSGNEVRIAGVEAGTVKDVHITTEEAPDPGHPGRMLRREIAQATLEINSDHWPLHSHDLIEVRPKGVLSNVYVSITPGDDRATALDTGRPVTSDRTRTPVNLDALQDVFTKPVRDSIRTQLQQGVIALGGDGQSSGAQNLGQTLTNAVPLTADLTPLTGTLADRSPELDRLNGEFATISGELASEDRNLRGLIENADTTLGAIAVRQDDLRGTLDHAAYTLAQLNGVLENEQPNLISLFRKLPTTLDKTKHANDLLTPIVTRVNPHVPNLDVLIHEFVTANGYQTNGVYALRVDASLSGTKASKACGGEPSEQGPNGCGNQPTSTTLPAPSPTTAADSTPGAPGDSQPVPFLGGLVG